MVEEKVKQGYKKTEVGIIPKDWDIKSLSQVGVFSKGKGIKKDESRSGTIPCVRYGEIYTFHNDYIKSYNSFISREIAKTSKQLIKGDLLFAGSGETKEEIGKCVAFIDDIEAYVGGDVIILSPKFGEPLFWGYLLNAPFIVKQKSSRGQGDAIVHIHASSLSDILVPIPQQSEQNNIAKSLVDIDKLLQSLEKLIDKKKKIKHGTMQQLLTGKKRLPGFSGEWEIKKFKEVTNLITCGIAATPNYVDSTVGVPFLSSTNVKNGKLIWKDYKYISKELHKKLYKNNPPEKNDILYSRVGSIGEAAIIEIDSEFSIYVSLTLIKLKNFIFNGFIVQLLNSDKYKSLANRTVLLGGGVGNLNVNVVREFEIPVPNIDEQKAIASILSDIDSEIEKLEHKLEKYKKVKQGMMQELLTGRIRLV